MAQRSRSSSRRSPRPDRLRQLSGVFDVRAAWKVEELIEQAPATGEVELDFSAVREYEDFGIAVLAQALKHRRPGHVALRGLRAPELRLLQAFGVRPSSRGVRLVAEGA